MPWDISQVDKHYSGLNDKMKSLWVSVANSALKSCLDKGGDAKECEISAIRQAASVVKKNLSGDGENSYYYLTDISDIKLEEKDNKKSSWIEIFRIGKWSHPKYGIIEGTKKLFNDFISNWEKNVLGREIGIDKTHNPEDGATGWVKDIQIVGDRLKALIEWTPWGIDLIENKGFKYFSPEYRDSYTNKETGQIHNNVLFGGALTNRPFLTDLSPIILSEDISENINLQQTAIAQSIPDKVGTYSMELAPSFIDIIRQLCFGGYIDITELKDFTLSHLAKVDFSQVTMSEEFKKELITLLEEYADHDEEKIKNIMDIMQEHMQESMKEMKTKDGEIMVRSVIKAHIQQMVKEIFDNMDWVKNNLPMVAKTKY